MHTLTNNVLTIQVASKGAELQSIYHEQNKLEYMWSADPAYWGKKSPVLFPIVGELRNNTYKHNGIDYHLSRHGFAREMEFELTEQTENSLAFSITSNEQTLEKYPFQFEFTVKYTLKQNIVSIGYVVKNIDDKVMYFSVGGHPAFKVPMLPATSFEDYYLLFEHEEVAGRYPLSKDGLIEMEPVVCLDNTNKLPLTKALFTSDALVFKNLRSTTVSIVSDKTLHGLKVSFDGFPYLGIWSTKGADFVCIEPWCGIADTVDSNGIIANKEGIEQLEPAAMFERSFDIESF